jgi:hypothetical protein
VAKGSRTRMSRAEQMERFLETAQALGCDPSEDLFGEIVRAIALARPGPPPTAPAAESTKQARPRRVSAEGARPVKDAKSTKRNAESTNDAGPRGATARHTTTRSVTIKSATTEARRNPKGSAKSKADETSTKIRAAKGSKATRKQSAAKPARVAEKVKAPTTGRARTARPRSRSHLRK